MTDMEEKKYEVIGKVIEGLITKSEAEEELSLSRRQINRLIIKYNVEGKSGFIHKNRGKESKKKIEQDIREEIINLYLSDCYDFNFQHFYEFKIKTLYSIGFMTMVNILTEAEILSPLAQHKTKNAYNKQMRELRKNENVPEEKQKLYESRLLLEEQAHTRKSTLFYKFGEELQMDAAEYIWFGNIVTYLHLVVDKATKIVVFGWFDYQETMRAYFVLLFNNTIYLYGIPRKIKTDKRKVFDSENGQKTHFGRACEELKIQLECNSNPLFKPNVERENSTFENRLKAELRYEGITTIKEANEYLNKTFIPNINNRFAFKIDNSKNLMRENKYSIQELSLIISERYPRIIDTGSCVKYNTKYYIPIDKDNKEIYYKNKTPAIVIKDYNNELWCLIEQNYYRLKEVKKQEYNPDKEVQEIKDKMIKERKQYIPPKNHPWRNFKI